LAPIITIFSDGQTTGVNQEAQGGEKIRPAGMVLEHPRQKKEGAVVGRQSEATGREKSLPPKRARPALNFLRKEGQRERKRKIQQAEQVHFVRKDRKGARMEQEGSRTLPFLVTPKPPQETSFRSLSAGHSLAFIGGVFATSPPSSLRIGSSHTGGGMQGPKRTLGGNHTDPGRFQRLACREITERRKKSLTSGSSLSPYQDAGNSQPLRKDFYRRQRGLPATRRGSPRQKEISSTYLKILFHL